MKATLAFTLPEENPEFRAAVEGQAARGALDAVREKVRGMRKWGQYGEETQKALDEVYDCICEEMQGLSDA